MLNKRKIISLFLCIIIMTISIPMHTYAGEIEVAKPAEDEKNYYVTENAVAPIANSKTVHNILEQYKFNAKQGHGFAAERGNNLADRIKGKNARVVGDNNVANGPDRIIINRDGGVTYIQDKYYSSARQGIAACFDESGVFRYVDGYGNPMQIEVPADQYVEAVELMRTKITEGKIPGVTNPAEAESLVKKGALTYKQACNLAKAGTIESLTYDATNGVVAASTAFGISTLISYAVYRINGMDRKEAIGEAAIEGVKTGIKVFGTAVIAGQLAKTSIVNVFTPSSEKLVRLLGKKAAEALVRSAGEEVIIQEGETMSMALTRTAARALRMQGLVAAVATVVFSIPDAIDLFKGKISKKQFVKNFAVTAVSITAGTVGFVAGEFVGNLVVPGVGSFPPGVVGSLLLGSAGGFVTDKIADYITDDDADEMYEILQNQFAQKCEDYMVNENEATAIVDELSSRLDKNMYKEMYQSKDPEKYADEILTPMFEAEIAKREKMEAPTEEELRAVLMEELEGIVFIH